MSKAFIAATSGRLLATATALGALAISACSGVGTPTTQSSALTATRLTSATPIPFLFQTGIDYPKVNETQVTGIDDKAEIVGTEGSQVYSGSIAGVQSFVSKPPYSSFSRRYYPALNTVLRSITIEAASYYNVTEEAGWIFSPQDGQCTYYACTFGAINDGGNWFATDDSKCTFDSENEVDTAFYGINEYGIASGYARTESKTSTCLQHGVLMFRGGSYKNEGPPAADSPIVTGIDNVDDIVGTAKISGKQVGWYQICKEASSGSFANGCGSYDNIVYVSTLGTSYQSITLSGINDNRLIVGSFGPAGSEGFILSVDAAAASTPYSVLQYVQIDSYPTVLTGINNNDGICGWYKTPTNSKTHGFVGIPNAVIQGKARRR